MNEPILEKNQTQLTSRHRLTFDKYNKTLSFKYQKRGGKGKNAPLIDSYDYGNELHYGSWRVLMNRLLDEELREGLTANEISDIDKLIKSIEKACEHIDKVATELTEHVSTMIKIDLGDSTTGRGRKKVVKGIEISDDEELIEGDAN